MEGEGRGVPPTQEEAAFRESAYPDVSVVKSLQLACTVCLRDVKKAAINNNQVYSHVHLGVLLCKSCQDFYGDGEFSIDEDGLDKYCRWCGQGGKLYICNECPTAFCKKCIKQNIDRDLWKSIKDDKWKCYVCSPQPLYKHRALCWAVQKHIQMQKSTDQITTPEGDIKQQKEKIQNGIEEVLIDEDDGDDNNTSDTMVENNPKLAEHVKIARKWLKTAVKDLKQFSNNLSAKGDKILKKDFVQHQMTKPSDIEKFVSNTTSTINSSIDILTNIRDTMSDYIKEWKVILDEAIEKEQERLKTLQAETKDKDKIDRKKTVENKDKAEGEKMDVYQDNGSEVDTTSGSIIDDSLIVEEEKEEEKKKKKKNESDEPLKENNSKEVQNKKPEESGNSSEIKPLLRVRNVEELNKAISENKTGDIFDQAEENGDSEGADVANGETSCVQESTPEGGSRRHSLSSQTTEEFVLEHIQKECPEKDTDANHEMTVDDSQNKAQKKNGIEEDKRKEETTKGTATKSSEKSSSPVANGVDATTPEREETAKANTGDGNQIPEEAALPEETTGESETVETVNEETPVLKAVDESGDGKQDAVTKEQEETKKADNKNDMENQMIKNILKTSSDDSSSGSSIDLTLKTDEKKLDKTKKKLKLSATKDKSKALSKKPARNRLLSSSSDGEIDKLLDISSLKKRPRKSGGRSSGNSSSGSNKGKARSKKKLKANSDENKKKQETSILDLMNSDNEENELNSSGSSLDLMKELSSLKTLNETPCTFEDITRDIYLASSLDLNSDSSSSENGDKDKDKANKNDKAKKGNKQKAGKSKKGSGETSLDEEGSKGKSKGDWRRNKMLTDKLTDSDSSELEEKYKKSKQEKKAVDSSDSDKKPKRRKRNLKFSDSDSSVKIDESSSTESSDEEAKGKNEEGQKKKRKRIQRMSTDSDTDDEKDSKLLDSGGKGRKNIRKVLKEESLEHSTKEALKEEQERKKRIAERQKLYNQMMQIETEKVTTLEKLVLDFDPDTKKELVSVDVDLVKKMKPHQAEGIKFIWDTCFESLKDAKKSKGSGCILAHCMGLGKSFQVVTMVHTLLMNPEVGVKTALVVCPLSTVLNWVNEFNKWLKDVGSGEDVNIFHLVKVQTVYRQYQMKDWYKKGGVMILGYNMYRQLTNPKMKGKPSVRAVFQETLVDPGPDVVICDEGHVLKNESTALSKAMSRLKTKRRIILTGTPLQNNLEEYHCMVQFVKPNLLGTKKEFKNRFVNPIQNGQFEDSTAHDVKVMKRRAHVLHKLLDGIVQRKDYNVLTPFLPPKLEYVISLNLSEVQCSLYQRYLDQFARGKELGKTSATLFKDWLFLTRICTHPRVLLMHREKEQLKNESNDEDSEGSLKDFIDDGSDSASSSSSSLESKSGSGSEKNQRVVTARSTRANPVLQEEVVPEVETRKDWWYEIVSEQLMEDVRQGSKIVLLLSILRKCEEIGDKLLVFSQSLYTLDLIEYFLEKIDEASQSGEVKEELGGYVGSWAKGLDYFRLDGQTASDNRSSFIDRFNREDNARARLFLISTKAGGLGINLVGANRAVIFDASWNPSYDLQSIFRIYRFGQKKPCYVYRLLAQGTIEERIYERQVAKLSIACRVIDEQQVDRHFSHSDLTELYTFKPSQGPQSTPILPKDRLMAEILQSHTDIISTYHHHDSLLENQEEEELNEEERRQAWSDFENEKTAPPPQPQQSAYYPNLQMQQDYQLQAVMTNLAIKLQQQHPNWTTDQIQQNASLLLAQWRTSFQNSFQQQQQQQQQQTRMWNQAMQLQQQQLQQQQNRANLMSGSTPRFQPSATGMQVQQRPSTFVMEPKLRPANMMATASAPAQSTVASASINNSTLVVNPKAIKRNMTGGTALSLQQLLVNNIQDQQQPTEVHEIDE